MDIKCRVCLATTEAKIYHSLATVFPEYMKSTLSVLDLLRAVTSTNVSMSYDFPDSICTACLKKLKDSYNFIEQFKYAQSWLEKNLEQKPEKIIVKVEASEDECLSQVVLDMDENSDVSRTDLEDEDSNIYETVTTSKREINSTAKIRKKMKPNRKGIVPRSTTENIILMSVEDILTDDTETPAYSNELADVKNVFIHNDHTYQKTFETSNEPDSKFCVMSVEDVLDSTTRQVERPLGVKRKKTKGILTQSIDLVKNLERKTRTRRARKGKVKEDEAESFFCDICQKNYESKKRFTSHTYATHGIPEWHEKFKCPICDLQCRTRSALVHHKLKHQGKQINCNECDKVYLTKAQLKEHKNRVHGNGVPAKFLCTECGKRFKFLTGLKYHIISAHDSDNKPYMCLYCGFKCAQESYLKRHERCHTDERPYKCKFCNKTFRGTSELLSHHQYHEKKFKYNCQYCGKGFVQTWNMKVHWLQHRGNYDCEICKRNFIDEVVLKFHYYHYHKHRDNGKEASEDTNSNEEEHNLDSLFSTVVKDEDTFSHNIF